MILEGLENKLESFFESTVNELTKVKTDTKVSLRVIESIFDFQKLMAQRKAHLGKVDECLICQLPLYNYSETMKLKCGHDSFHSKCVTDWLNHNPQCPYCRAP